jgi:hypothetical protein
MGPFSAMIVRFARWFVFGVVLALLPIIADFLIRRIDGGDPMLAVLLGRGELHLVTAGLCSSAIGELLGTGKSLAFFKIFSGGSCLGILFCASFAYAHIAERLSASAQISTNVVCHDSLILYLGGVIAGACSVILAELAP